VAENLLKTSRLRLAQLAFFRPNGTVLPRMLEPSEAGQPEGVHIDEDAALVAAMAERPEVLASAKRRARRQYDERIHSNQLLPRFDVVGSYGLLGSRARIRKGLRAASTWTSTAIRARAHHGVPEPSAPSAFRGNESRAYDRLGSGNWDQYHGRLPGPDSDRQCPGPRR
jgi:hypothetical protein